jgi:hypothetical protein
LAFCKLRPDDQVHVAGFIFQRHEDHATGAARPLARDHQARNPDRIIPGHLAQFFCSHETLSLQTHCAAEPADDGRG